jgi:predicted PurR-regulated permease PerM
MITQSVPNGPGRPGALRILLAVASMVVVVAGMRAATPILIPFLLAVFIAVISAPLFLAMQRRGVPSVVALLLMALMLAAVGFAGLGIVRSSLDGFYDNRSTYQSRLQEQTADAWKRLEGTEVWKWLESKGVERPHDAVSEAISPQVVIGYLSSLTSALSGALSKAFLILLVVIFILLEATVLPAKVRALPGVSDAHWARLQQVVEEIRRYMSLKTLISLATGALVAVFTALLGVDYPILLGLLAFFLNYIPNVGSIVAGIPGVLLAFIEFGVGWAAIVALGYVAVNTVMGNVIEPRLMGRGLGLSPLVILLSMIFWGWVLGPVGMLLSVPLTMTVKVAMESSQETRWIALLMGSAPPTGAASQSEPKPNPEN